MRDFYAGIDEAQKGALIQEVPGPTIKEPEDFVKKEETFVDAPANNTVRVIKLY